MFDAEKAHRRQDLERHAQAALVKLDRELQALEAFGARRVLTRLEEYAADLDLAALQSIIVDLSIAKREYDAFKAQLKRL